MSVTTHEPGLDSLDALEGVDALCVFISEDERPLQGLAGYADWRLCGRLSRVLQDGFFLGSREDSLLVPTNGRLSVSRVFALGLGKSARVSAEELDTVLRHAARVLTQARVQSVALEVPGAASLDEAVRAQALKTAFLPAFRGGRVAVLAEKSLSRLVA